MPETSVIIRTYNEEKHLGNLLDSLSKQVYKNFEVIIVDAGSTDKTVEIAERYKTRIIKIESRDFTFGYALNLGCKEARGRYLVFVSAHVLPSGNDWLSSLLSPFSDNKVAIVYGRQLSVPESKFSEKMDFKRLFGATSVNYKVPKDYANNANSAIRKDLWEINQFDEYLFGLEDIDWARKISKEGYLIKYEPKAAIHHIHQEEWHQVFNRYRREAIAAVRIGLPHPPQSKTGYLWLMWRLIHDSLFSFPNWSFNRLEEIFRFRYYQWKGSRVGWKQGVSLDIEKDKQDVLFSIINKSVIITGNDKANFEEVSLREMRPGDILVRVEYVGICRTDLEILEGNLGYYRDGVADYPIVPGHEFSGAIVRIGSNNKFRERFKVGQKVVGECILSRKESDRKEVGVINYNGAYSQYIVMPGDALHKIPDGLDTKKAALTEPLAVALRAIRRIETRLKVGAKLAVVGAGPIGFLCAHALKIEGYNVTVFDKNYDRLKILKDPKIVTDTILTDIDTFDAIIEATGSKEVLETIIEKSRNDATIMLLGFPYGDVHYNFEDLVGKEKFLAGSVGGDREDFIKALSLLSKIDIPDSVQTVMPLEDFREAWDLHRTSKFLKIFLQP